MGELVAHLMADRRLYVTADRATLVEEGDPAGSWLLYPVGRKVGAGDVKRYGLEADEFGRVTYEGCPALPKPAPVPVPEKASKSKSKKAKPEAAAEGADDSDRNAGEVPEWPGRTSPEKYLKLYPTGPKAELAKAVIAAQDDGADGGS